MAAIKSPHGRWAIVALTALLVGADLVAVGPGWVALATVIVLGVLNIKWITDRIHERGIAGLIGALLALYLILLLEIYLGSTGLWFGPLGAIARGGLASVDTGIIWVLNLTYRHAGSVKSFVGGIIFAVLYFILYGVAAKLANSVANFWAGVGGFVLIVLAFPFAQGLEGKPVAFTKATLDVSSSLKTLGAYEAARQQAIKDNAALKALAAELRDDKREADRQALAKAIQTYADLLVQLDDDGRAHTRILYQPEDAYDTTEFLALPPATPARELEVGSVEANADDDVSATSVAHAEELHKKRDALLSEMARLRHERDMALTAIRNFVGDEVNAELAKRMRSEVSDDARSAIMQVIALRNMADATRALQSEIAELRAKLLLEEQRNRELADAVARYRQFKLAQLRRDAQCADVRRAVASWLTAGDGTDVMRRLTGRWDESATALRRDRPPIDVVDAPSGLNQERLEKSITDELGRDGVVLPPAYTEDALARDLVRVNETAGGTLGTFINASCRAGQNDTQIEGNLMRIADQLQTPTPPNPNLR